MHAQPRCHALIRDHLMRHRDTLAGESLGGPEEPAYRRCFELGMCDEEVKNVTEKCDRSSPPADRLVQSAQERPVVIRAATDMAVRENRPHLLKIA